MERNVRSPRGNIALSFGLGVLSVFAWFFVAESFEVKGQNSAREMVAGGTALAILMALFQFLVSRRAVRSRTARWPALVSMLAPLFAIVMLAAALEPRAFLPQAVPMFLTGCAGALAGSFAASNCGAVVERSLR